MQPGGGGNGGGANPGSGGGSALDMQRFQQQLQAQYQPQQQQAQPQATATAAAGFSAPVAGLNPALAMMQPQQAQLHPSTGTGMGMLGWGMPQQQQQPPSQSGEAAPDAGAAGGARLMATMMHNPLQQQVAATSSMPNMQALMQQQQQQLSNQAALTGNFQQAQQQILQAQQQQQQQGKPQNSLFPQQPQQPVMMGTFNGAAVGLTQPQQPVDSTVAAGAHRGAVTASQQILFQQQFANLQKQMQQGGSAAVAANAAVAALRNAAANLQMQGAPGVGVAAQPAMNANAVGGNQLLRQQLQQQQFLMQQQQQQQQPNDPSTNSMMNALQRPGQFSNTGGTHGSLGMHSINSQTSLNSLQQPQTQATLTDQQLRLHQQQQLMLQQQQQSQDVSQWQQQQQQKGGSMRQDVAQGSTGLGDQSDSGQQHDAVHGHDVPRSYLNGTFVGGWQSNSDLPDRRRVIFQILDVIRAMRPENNKMNDKLPHMAKSLEEHLYRTAPSKEEYLNTTTLKSRLQAIAQGLEMHRSSSSTSINSQQQGYSQPNAFGQQAQPESSHSYAGDPQGAAWALQQQQPGYNNQASSLQQGLSAQNQSGIGQGTHQGIGNLHAPSVTGKLPQQDSTWGNMQSSMVENSNNGLMSQQLNQFQHQQEQGQNNFLTQPIQPGLGNLNNSAVQGGVSEAFTSSLQQSQQQQQLDMWGAGLNQGETYLQSDISDPNSMRFQDTDAVQKKRVIAQQQQRLLLLRHASKCVAGPACTTRFCSQMVTLWRHMKTCRDKNCKTPHCLSSRCVLNHYRICKSQGKTATCEVCGPVMAKIKQLEREDGTIDPLVSQNEAMLRNSGTLQHPNTQGPLAMSAPQLQQQPMQLMPQVQQYGVSVQAQQQQQLQAQIKLRLEQLQQLQKQQTQLLEQQKRLQEQEQRIDDPNSQQAYQLHQQQTLLGELQKRCQQQQQFLQNELQQQTSNIAVLQQSQPHLLQSSSRLTQNLHQGASQPLQVGLAMGAQQLQSQDTPQPVQFSQQQSQLYNQTFLQTNIGDDDAQKVNLQSSNSNIIRGKAARRASGMGKGFTNISASRVDVPKAQKKRNTSIGGKERSQKKAKAAAALALAPLSRDLDLSERSVPPDVLPSSAVGTSHIMAMTRQNIMRHLESLNKRIRLSSRTVTHKCLPIIQEIIDDPFGWVFLDPVDPVALGLPDYFEVVKNPMHLELVKKKLENAIYADLESFARDARLVFGNAILYNGEESEVGTLARSLLTKFDELYAAVIQGIESSQQTLETKGEACSLCGTQKRMFEPTILYCRGKCKMQRIKRQESYFTDRTKQNHWCLKCYELLQPDEAIVLDDGTEVFKKDLQEFKNDALPEEGWVNCDECNSWIHQICALFNGRTNKTDAPYTCPKCYLKKADAGLLVPPVTSIKGASDLPQSKLSQAIENGLVIALQAAYESRAKELAVGIEEVEKAEGLSVRILSNVEKRHFVGNGMTRIYESKGYSVSFPYKSKCIALFQTIDGVDTLLFSMYVYEYGQDCPAPNRRRVYISYLDSVQYFEPRCYRTVVYQTILIEYLRHVKRRGFHTAHIWSCPPTPGDDYIFYCHPDHQKFPREDMLRTWYMRMLDKAKLEGIVIQTTTLFDEYFADDVVHVDTNHADSTRLPYFEGDYIPGELEKILSTMNSEETPAVSEAMERELMRRLGHNVMKMKDNFFVAYLRNRRFAAAVERGEDVSNWPEDSDDEVVRSKRAKISGKDSETLMTTMEPSVPPTVAQRASAGSGGTECPEPPTDSDKDDKLSRSVVHECGTTSSEAKNLTLDEADSPVEATVMQPESNKKDDTELATKDEDLATSAADMASAKAEEKDDVETTLVEEPAMPPTKRDVSDSKSIEEQPSNDNDTRRAPSEADLCDDEGIRTQDSTTGNETISQDCTDLESLNEKNESDSGSRAVAEEQLEVSSGPNEVSSSHIANEPSNILRLTATNRESDDVSGGVASSHSLKHDDETSFCAAPSSEIPVVHMEHPSSDSLAQEESIKTDDNVCPEPKLSTVDPPDTSNMTGEISTGCVSSSAVHPQADTEIETNESRVDVDLNAINSQSTGEPTLADAVALPGAAATHEATEVPESEAAAPEISDKGTSGEVSSKDADQAARASDSNDNKVLPQTIANNSPENQETGAVAQFTNKRSLEEIAPIIKSHFAGEGIVHSGQLVGDTSDADELVESEMFESRQQFLNYCQANHCQFDEQRRAKHSSMMVLFHLHNPAAPKFLQQCCACYVDITHGIRYHCNSCPDFDLCQDCFEPVISGEWARRDARFAHDETHTFTPINTEEEATQGTAANRKDSRAALRTHIALLEHTGSCVGAPTCSLQNCVRMKSLFDHMQTCTIKPKKDCRTCSRLLSLVAMHSRICCAREHCPIPFCDRIRERYTRLRQQQQLMDDRRRQAQNELYHAAES